MSALLKKFAATLCLLAVGLTCLPVTRTVHSHEEGQQAHSHQDGRHQDDRCQHDVHPHHHAAHDHSHHDGTAHYCEVEWHAHLYILGFELHLPHSAPADEERNESDQSLYLVDLEAPAPASSSPERPSAGPPVASACDAATCERFADSGNADRGRRGNLLCERARRVRTGVLRA